MKSLFLNFLFILQLIIYSNSSAQIIIKGKVISQSQKAIEYAHIVVEGEEIGTLSDSKGNFELNIPEKYRNKNLIISAVGFEKNKLEINSISSRFITITLKTKAYELEEITVTDKKVKLIEVGQVNYKKLQKYGFGYGNPKGINRQIALFIPNDKGYNGYIKDVTFRFYTGKTKHTPFGVRLYTVGEDGLPDEDLLPENLITSAKKLKRWHKVNLEKYNLSIPEKGFFVAMEWIYTDDKRYNQDIMSIRRDSIGNIISRKKRTYFGQSLEGVLTNSGDCRTYWGIGGKKWFLSKSLYYEGKCHQALIKATLEVYE